MNGIACSYVLLTDHTHMRVAPLAMSWLAWLGLAS